MRTGDISGPITADRGALLSNYNTSVCQVNTELAAAVTWTSKDCTISHYKKFKCYRVSATALSVVMVAYDGVHLLHSVRDHRRKTEEISSIDSYCNI